MKSTCGLPFLYYLFGRVVEIISLSCYCTETHCNLGVCEALTCSVGLKPDGSVTRRCEESASTDSKTIKCQSEVENFTKICYCYSPYCNTLAFLLDQGDDSDALSRDKHNIGGESDLKTEFSHSSNNLKQIQNKFGKPARYNDDYPYHQDFESIDRVDRLSKINSNDGKQAADDFGKNAETDFYDELMLEDPDDGPTVTITRQRKFETRRDKQVTDKRAKADYTLVTVVVISMTIMAFAISVVMLNYYCKLC